LSQTKTERALQAAEIRQRAVLEHIIDGIITIDALGTVQSFNRAAEKIFGYTAAEVIGSNINRLMPDPYATEHDGYLHNYMTTGKARIIGLGREVAGLRKNGTTFPLELAVSEMEIDGERLFSGIVRDITERKAAERALQAAEIRQRAVLEHIIDGIITIDALGTVQSFNRAAEKIFGYTAAEVIGSNINRLMPDPYATEHDGYLHNYMTTGKARIIGLGREVAGLRKNGTTFPLELAVSEMEIDGERLFSGIVRDITERKAAERALIEARNFAEDSARAKADFLANMSHEIRTPMNAVINLSYLALKGNLDPKTRDYLKKIESSSKNLLGIINDILDFSKIEAGKLELESIPFNLHKTLNELATIIGYRALENNIEVLFRTDPAVPVNMIGDSLRLSQVLTNLLANAIKFTQEGEVVMDVRVTERKNDEYNINFSIADTGIGMSKEQQENLFTPFKQADGSISRKYGGTGLGLVISRYLVSLMHGEISVASEEGKGSTFSFTVPLKHDSVPDPGYAYTRPSLGSIRVLVVDDNPTARLVATDTIRALGMQVDDAGGGKQALEMLARANATADNAYKVVLLDWRMPGLDGLETMAAIKETPAIKIQPKIVLCTAFGIDAVSDQDSAYKADAYLGKPFNNSTLLNAICNCLGVAELDPGKQEAADSTDTIPGIEKIANKHVLLVDDNEINQMIAADLLESQGVRVTTADSAKEAFARLESNQFDLVLMDVQMPEMDGLEATRHIRNNPRYNELPIIAMTAHAMESDREKSLAAGMNAHLTKPIEPNKLYQALIEWTAPGKRLNASTTENQTMSDNPLPDSIPGFDLKIALAQVRGNSALLYKLLIKFLDQYSSASQALREQLENGSREDAIRLVHSIKGVAGSLGAINLFENATTLEKQLRDETSNPDTRQFDASLDQVINGIASSVQT